VFERQTTFFKMLTFRKGDKTMKDSSSLHQKVQDLCNCFSNTDPLREMSNVPRDGDVDEAALKWLALAALHGVNNNAKKISFEQADNGDVKVTAEYNKTELPSPGADVGKKVFEAVKEITHIDNTKGKTRLALGLLDSSLELDVKVKDKPNSKKISLKFT